MGCCYEVMKQRRTTRRYKRDPLPDGVVERIIQAGIYAPSGSNKSPYLVAVVSDFEVKKRIREEAEAVEREFYRKKGAVGDEEFLDWVQKKDIRVTKPFLTEAPVLLVVFEDSRWSDRHSLESTWLTIAYMILAAEQEGLGTVTYTPEPKTFLNTILGIEEHYRPQVILPLGFPQVRNRKVGNRPSVEERTTYFA